MSDGTHEATGVVGEVSYLRAEPRRLARALAHYLNSDYFAATIEASKQPDQNPPA